ncbi:MAG: BLUF domain-containing protein [Pseudomonadota bacterium]
MTEEHVSEPDDRLYRLIYVSTAKEDLRDDDISNILNTSQSNNFERYITGFLAHNGSSFMQALEGPEGEVRQTYESIVEDGRHQCVVQIAGERISRRAFEDWSMNYHRVDDPHGAMEIRLNEPIEDLLPASAPRDLLVLFARFITVDKA